MFDLRPLYMFYKPGILSGTEVQRFTRITDPALISELQAIKARMYPDSWPYHSISPRIAAVNSHLDPHRARRSR